MNSRSDLAIEQLMNVDSSIPEGRGYVTQVTENEVSTTTTIEIQNEEGEQALGKPKGKYVTVEVPPFGKDGEVTDERMDAVCNEVLKMIPQNGPVLVVGLGNRDITPDAIGPKVLTGILATRHLSDQLTNEIGLPDLRDVSGIIPGVLGQTGIEVQDIIKGVSDIVKPSAIICIDALAARDTSRLGCTVQITDAGVAPGSGVGNGRPQINEASMGIPVISIGVPTVISVLAILEGENLLDEGKDLKEEFQDLIVTPKEIDLLVTRASKLISLSLNKALFPSLSITDILSLID